MLRRSQFADVQANVALALAKRVGLSPRATATRIVEHLDIGGVCSSVQVSGPGFINFVLSDEWVAAQAGATAGDKRL